MIGGYKRKRSSTSNGTKRKRTNVRSNDTKINCLAMSEDAIFKEFKNQLEKLNRGKTVKPFTDIGKIIGTSKKELGEGSFNKVYSYKLNDKCSEGNTSVLIRISKEPLVNQPHDTDNNELIQSVKNICDMSKKNIHPKVYNVQLKQEGELIIMMEHFEAGNLSHYMEKLSKEASRETIKNVHESIAKQCSMIIDKIVDNKLACLDIKPLNIVIKETPGDIEPVKVRFIDFDADWCIPEKDTITKAMNTILNQIKVTERGDVVKLFLKLLLANHLYTYDKNNIMAPLLNRNYPGDTQHATTKLIEKILFRSDETIESIKSILTHYFKKYDIGYIKDEGPNVEIIKKVFLIRGFVKDSKELIRRKRRIRRHRSDKRPITRRRNKKINAFKKTRRKKKKGNSKKYSTSLTYTSN